MKFTREDKTFSEGSSQMGKETKAMVDKVGHLDSSPNQHKNKECFLIHTSHDSTCLIG